MSWKSLLIRRYLLSCQGDVLHLLNVYKSQGEGQVIGGERGNSLSNIELWCKWLIKCSFCVWTERANKAKRLFHALARLGGQGWGYQAVNYIILYKVLFHSICAYAAHGWERRLRQRHQRQLLAAQRQVLIRTTKAYATASTDCLPVVAGVLPIDLYIQRRIHRYRDYQLPSDM